MSDHIIFETSNILNNRFRNINCDETQNKKDEKEIQFVSQFLELTEKQEEIPTTILQNQQKQETDICLSSDMIRQASSNLENSSQTKRTRSIFHNFQKHLVTTLKNNITLNKNHAKNDVTAALANKMWAIFQKSNYYSKRILHFLFGVTSSNKQTQESETNNKIFPGFLEVTAIHSKNAIEQAQQYLRRQVYRQGNKLISKKLLSNRRMQKSQEFQSYFSKFLEEIQNGAISKRLPKPSKIDVIHNMMEDQKQNL